MTSGILPEFILPEQVCNLLRNVFLPEQVCNLLRNVLELCLANIKPFFVTSVRYQQWARLTLLMPTFLIKSPSFRTAML
jgi:hypothetical protein